MVITRINPIGRVGNAIDLLHEHLDLGHQTRTIQDGPLLEDVRALVALLVLARGPDLVRQIMLADGDERTVAAGEVEVRTIADQRKAHHGDGLAHDRARHLLDAMHGALCVVPCEVPCEVPFVVPFAARFAVLFEVLGARSPVVVVREGEVCRPQAA